MDAAAVNGEDNCASSSSSIMREAPPAAPKSQSRRPQSPRAFLSSLIARSPAASAQTQRPLAVRILLTCLIAFVGGTGSLQAALLQRTGVHFLGLFLFGTMLSFVGGLVLLTFLVLEEWWRDPVVGSLPLLQYKLRPSPHHLLPGAFGAFFVTISLSVTLIISYSLFFVLSTIGFITMGILIDAGGLFGARRVPVTLLKLGILLIAALGAVLSALDRLLLRGASSLGSAPPPGWLLAVCVLLSLTGGFLLPLQAGINRDAAVRLLPSRLQSAWWSFFWGSVVACIALAVQVGIGSDDQRAGINPAFDSSQLYMYMGGPLGVLYVVTSIWGVALVGSAPFFVAMLCGQLVGSALIDAIGLLGGAVVPLTPLRGVGIAIVITAALCLQVDGRALWAAMQQLWLVKGGGRGGSTASISNSTAAELTPASASPESSSSSSMAADDDGTVGSAEQQQKAHSLAAILPPVVASLEPDRAAAAAAASVHATSSGSSERVALVVGVGQSSSVR